MEPGSWLRSPLAQQSYASINYTHVARSVLAAGANVIAQQVALRPGGRVSLGTNPDVTADLIPMLRERERAGTPVAMIGQANDRMPFMFGAAEQPASEFDFLVDDPSGYHELIAPPNLPISTADPAIAPAASMPIPDGGTIPPGAGQYLRCHFSDRIIEEERNTVRQLEVRGRTGQVTASPNIAQPSSAAQTKAEYSSGTSTWASARA